MVTACSSLMRAEWNPGVEAILSRTLLSFSTPAGPKCACAHRAVVVRSSGLWLGGKPETGRRAKEVKYQDLATTPTYLGMPRRENCVSPCSVEQGLEDLGYLTVTCYTD